MDSIWDDKYALTDMLFETNKSLQDIAEYFDCSRAEISRRIKLLGLSWVRRGNRKVSRGQAALTQILQKILPSERIVNEHHLGERLRLDIYCPNYNLGIEYHGRQHFIHVAMFHETYDDFMRAKERDERKKDLCREQDIDLVVFKYCDKLSEDFVYERILEEIKKTKVQEPSHMIKAKRHTLSTKNNPSYDSFKLKKKEFERDLRKKIKQENKVREQKKKEAEEAIEQ